jgi:nucleoside-diphosphate-sugar epimerase
VIRSTAPVVLLTGATGLVGGELIPRLLATRPDRLVVALSRNPAAIHQPRVVALRGDLTRPGLALTDDEAAWLRTCVTQIVHCAAETRFGLPLAQARAMNVDGTGNLINFARGCGRLAKFAHISTVFVVGRSTGWLAEAPLRHGNGFTNTYQQSKYEAEDLVFDAMRELPAAVLRLSSIIGDSRTGRVRQFNYVHQLLRLFPRNVLPIIPGDADAPVDLIASDWTGAALSHVFENAFPTGQVRHLCAGPEASLTLREMLDLTVRSFEQHPRGRAWLPLRVPTLVSVSEFEAYVAEQRRGGDPLLNELLRVLGLFLPHLGMFQAFDTTQSREDLARGDVCLPAIRDYYPEVVRHCLDTNWGTPAKPSHPASVYPPGAATGGRRAAR